jgi:hypothetical protein
LFIKPNFVALYYRMKIIPVLFFYIQTTFGFSPLKDSIGSSFLLSKYNFIAPQLEDTVYENQLAVAKVSESIEESTKHISTAFKSASYQLFLQSEQIEKIGNQLEIWNDAFGDYIHDKETYISNLNQQIGYLMVKIISSILPYVDTIGHKVLHMDDEIINYFINLENISPELKKNIILGIIHISQDGDHFGAQMLQLYYDIVNKLM